MTGIENGDRRVLPAAGLKDRRGRGMRRREMMGLAGGAPSLGDEDVRFESDR